MCVCVFFFKFPNLVCLRVDFPLSRNFYVCTCVKFTFANKIEGMHERLLVSVKVEPRSTCRLSSVSTFYLASILI